LNHPFIHASAEVKSEAIGLGTSIWQFVLVFPRATIGADCIIHSHCVVEDDVVIGDRVTVQSGVQLWNGLRIGNDVFIGPNATFTNDRISPEVRLLETVVESGASIGSGAVIQAGVRICANAVITAGAVVTRSVPPGAIVEGSPASIIGYVGAERSDHDNVPVHMGGRPQPMEVTLVRGVTVHHFSVISDLRGDLIVGEFQKQIPFTPMRYFMVFGVPSREIRGEHAHYTCHQFLVCVRGNCSVVADDGKSRVEVGLDTSQKGLYLPPMTWGIQYKYSPDAVLLVFASHHYDGGDYIRDYDEFLALVRSK
jgi:UDP-2-acetamido-3-amino-2,3-dideoxy-glucuronate N-acetyltransferase